MMGGARKTAAATHGVDIVHNAIEKTMGD